MNTPDLLMILNNWLKNHYLLITCCVGLSTYIGTNVVSAGEFEAYVQRSSKAINILDSKARLNDIRYKIDSFSKIPIDSMPPELIRELESLKRQRKHLERDINS